MRRVVVTGAGVVSPIGTGLPAFFEGLRRGRPGVDTIRSFDAGGLPTRIAGEVRDMDLEAVPLPEAEGFALRRDPKSVFGIVAAREALAGAFGAGPRTERYEPSRMGAFLATGLEIFHLEDIVPHVRAGIVDAPRLLESLEASPALARLQIPADLGARRIAREAGAEGFYSVNVSACTASTQSLGEAFRAIRDGRVDAAITGGYDSMVNPLGVGGFCLLEALSTRNDLRGAASRPFDARRDGFVLGEGAGICVLEEYEEARKRSAPILAEVLGYGSTLDAYRVTDPAPDHAGAAAAMGAALADAGLPAAEVDYINAHGTGTRANDPAEVAAIRSVFGERADRIPVSSTKSQIGHLIGAAGAVEFLAALFALKKGIVPATINLTDPDPECDLDFVPLIPRRAPVRTVMSNSFGFGGQNAVILAGELR